MRSLALLLLLPVTTNCMDDSQDRWATCRTLFCITSRDSGPVPDAELFCDYVNQIGCDADQRCVSEVVHYDPLLSNGKCAPAGHISAGLPCSVISDEIPYDDCEAGLFCAEGLCRPMCFNEYDCRFFPDLSQCTRSRSEPAATCKPEDMDE